MEVWAGSTGTVVRTGTIVFLLPGILSEAHAVINNEVAMQMLSARIFIVIAAFFLRDYVPIIYHKF